MKSFVVFIFSLCFVLACRAGGVERDEYPKIVESLQQRLAQNCSRHDSVAILSNLYDLYQTYNSEKSDSVAELVFSVAKRDGNDVAALEMLCMLANSNVADIAKLNKYLDEAKSFPKESKPEETITFIQMVRNYYFANRADDEARKVRFREQMRQFAVNPPKDIYDRIQLLHAVCVNIARESNGELLSEYIDELGELINKLPASNRILRNIYFVQSAIAYAKAGETRKAIENDMRLISVMDSLESHYASVGRPYRNFGANRYIVYTRLLSHWENLTPDEIEEYYGLALKYRDLHPRARATYENRPMPEIYYALAHERYDVALPLLKDQVDNMKNPYRVSLLKSLIKVAEAVGDKATAYDASLKYAQSLEKALDSRMRDNLKKFYDTYSLKNDLDRLLSDKEKSESRLQRTISVIVAIALLGLLILVFLLVRLYRHSKKLADTLVISNEALKSESASLRISQKELTEARDAAQRANQFKTDFIKNMSREVSVPLNAMVEYSHLIIDCVDTSNRPYLERYAEQIEMNGVFLTAVINDVLHLSEIDSESISLNRQLVDLRKITELSVESISSRISPDVKVVFDPESTNHYTFTDPRRVQQILVNVIGNAAKFTDKGHIFLECHIVNDGKEVAIAVSDTGIGIPSGQGEHIFERFVKLDKETQGLGLGLPISRLLARLLGGDLILDTTYTRGARFILTLPYKEK